MQPLILSLTTFLKISARKPRTKIRELRTFTAPGGYDFYKVLKKLASGLANGKIEFADAKTEISKIKLAPERKHTLEAITRFYAWLTTQPVFKWESPPKDFFTSHSGLLKIRLAPEIGFHKGPGKPMALHLWNLNAPALTSSLAAQGVRLMIDKLPSSFSYGIFDIRRQQIHTEASITPSTDGQLELNLQIAEMLWKDLHDSSLGTEDMVDHIDALLPP